MQGQLAFRHPFPSRKAAESLRDQVVNFLLTSQPTVGDRFPTEAELVQMTGLSRSTIRRGLELLRQEGWIQSRAGSGTTVGPKVSNLVTQQAHQGGNVTPSSGTIRLAVVVFEIGDFLGSWYWREVLAGIDEVAEQSHLSLELIGGLNGSTESIERRLQFSRPNLIACMGSEPRHAFIVRTAETLKVPCAVVGTRTWDSGGIELCEDNDQIVETAVNELFELGHRRIALVIGRDNTGWVFERHRAFYRALEKRGVTIDEQLVHWMDYGQSMEKLKTGLREFIVRRQPTALLTASFAATDPTAALAEENLFRVPDDMSIVSIDQYHSSKLQNIDLTYLEIPLREFGRRLAKLAVATTSPEPLPASIKIPGYLHRGNSTARAAR